MDSPERNLTVTAADTQGSPLFNYLCSLSPIKPVKSVHMAQTFSELSFPPPPAVFVSPRVDAQKDSSFLTRGHSKSREEIGQAGAESCQGNIQSNKGKSFIVHLTDSESRQLSLNQVLVRGRNLGSSKTVKGSQEKDHTLASPCSSPSKLGNKYVEQYLAEPIEEELYSVGTSQQCTQSNSFDTKPSTLEPVYKDADSSEDLGECKKISREELGTSSLVSLEFTGDNRVEMGGGAGLGEKRMDNAGTGLKDDEGMDFAKEASACVEDLNPHECGNDEQALELDQTTTDFAFLLSEGTDKFSSDACMDDWQNPSSSTLSELSLQHMTGYLATMREIVNEEAQETGMGNISTHVTTNSFGDTRPEVATSCKQEAEPEAGSDQQGGAGCRASIPPQRGVRRRCLDFEASEAQLKGKSNLSSSKPLSIQGGSSCGSDVNISLSVLRERAAATSDATNSESSQGLDTCTYDSSRTEPAASSKAVRSNPAMTRLSRCSSLNDAECMSDKPDSQLVCVIRPSGTSPVPVGMPSGIGLHLNSLTGSMAFSQTTRENEGGNGLLASSKAANALPGIAPLSGLQESPSDNYGNCLLAVSTGGSLQVGSAASFGQGLVVSLVEKTRMDEREVQSAGSDQVGVTKSMTCFRSVTLGIKSLEGNLPFSGLEKKLSPLGRKRVLLQDFPRQLDLDGPEDSSQSPRSPKKKRKSAPTGEKNGDGCKRCNCKKSKCLKLYCECFAAGVYCVDSCACHDCFNKPEFEDTVLGTRQQIESRNPLAFAPKIIRAADSSPTNGEECADTPASARHKRGCNCKKSQCLKKYCECYQAGVGCSDGCRCESCKNMYGRKEGSEDFEDKELQGEPADKEIAEDQVDTSDFCSGFTHPARQQNNDLSPITPSFQYAGQSRSTVKSRSASKRRFPSEELHSPTFSLSAAKPPKSPSRLLRSSKAAHNSSTSAGMQLPKIAGSPISTPKMLRIGQFSPRWDGLGDICTLTPLPQAPLRPTPASASILDGADSSPSFNGQQCNELSSSGNGSVGTGSKFLRGSSPVFQHPISRSSVCTSSSHHFQTPVNVQRTPMTPIFSSPLCASGSKSGFDDSDVYCHQFGGSTEDDSTPDFLKDPDTAGSPRRILKTTSPKQKRVSPPHHQGSRDTANRGIASPGLRSGRKFILQAISSLPPATPFSAAHEQVSGNTKV